MEKVRTQAEAAMDDLVDAIAAANNISPDASVIDGAALNLWQPSVMAEFLKANLSWPDGTGAGDKTWAFTTEEKAFWLKVGAELDDTQLGKLARIVRFLQQVASL
jgi:hypothetical protein